MTPPKAAITHMGIERQQIRDTQEGKHFTLGRYEQDNKPGNGPEPIQWMVLARDGDRVLVISRYILDCVRYDEEYRRVTWETCTLRAWLNGEFLDSAFDADEQLLIPTTHVTADPNPDFTMDPGEDTEDKLFLLSIPEAEAYFHPDPYVIPLANTGDFKLVEKVLAKYEANPSTLYCKPTAYAAARGNIPRGAPSKAPQTGGFAPPACGRPARPRPTPTACSIPGAIWSTATAGHGYRASVPRCGSTWELDGRKKGIP